MSMLDFLLEADAPDVDVDAEKEVEKDDVKVDEAFLESVVLIECNEDPFDRMLRVANEAKINHNALINAVAQDELKYLRENGEEKPETKKDKLNIIEAIKKIIRTALGKIQGAIKDLFDKVQEWDGIDKQFLKANEDKIKKADGKTVKGKFYKFTNLDVDIYSKVKPSGVGADIVKAAHGVSSVSYKEITEKWNSADGKEAMVVDIRTSMIGGNGADVKEDKDFQKALFNYFRNGGKEEDTMKFDANACINAIKGTKNLKQELKKFYRPVESQFKTYNKLVDALEKTLKAEKPDKDGKVFNKAFIGACSAYTRTLISSVTVAYEAHMKAIVSNNRIQKSLAKAAIKAAGKEDKKETSANEGSSFLESLEII